MKKQTENIYRKPVFYVHKEDIGFGDLVPILSSLVAKEKSNEKKWVGFLAGSGALLSIVSYINVSEWWIIDNNTFVLDWIKKSIAAINRNKTLQNYEKYMYSNLLSKEAKKTGLDMHQGLFLEKYIFGKFHFLKTSKNYLKTRSFINKKPMHFFLGDLGDRNRIKAILDTLKKGDAEIVYADISDLHTFNAETLKTLSLIFTRQDIVIAWSAKEKTKSRFPSAHFSIGLSSYQSEVRKVQSSY
ncbi:hypothetical protein A3D77_01720 [Candidatus Gottesmanbacteria bacterium RIFCSPHIGHO2_02_FULL_39_11]|uniref:Uncharacterized protein n=1 Tax=Candidatus Gottesmanbacteria bacterium RIFCSPHIGHO2_02_FULL_39_11 TaxID=1798382 RepID=A0A1F5ZTM9_9BACT|nr:MAG: hypothetical protein A3D77_01720 [Candidatus Gottesmanbacteria bacterium RIFCSPHIGHO2_02_FULL_39_11]